MGLPTTPQLRTKKDFHELSVEGVETKSGAKVQISTRSRSGTSPVEQSVERRIAAVTYSANLAVLKVADDMVGETIDILNSVRGRHSYLLEVVL